VRRRVHAFHSFVNTHKKVNQGLQVPSTEPPLLRFTPPSPGSSSSPMTQLAATHFHASLFSAFAVPPVGACNAFSLFLSGAPDHVAPRGT
jgi:hypothetical protein